MNYEQCVHDARLLQEALNTVINELQTNHLARVSFRNLVRAGRVYEVEVPCRNPDCDNWTELGKNNERFFCIFCRDPR